MFTGQKMLIGGGELEGAGKRVAVIGCGVAGLVSMKTALDYGHTVVGFERLSDIGGLWNFEVSGTRDSYAKMPEGNVPCYPSYASLVTNTSKYNTMFSDFMPLKSTKGEFLTHDELLRYVKSYAEHFKLVQNIRFNTHVTKVDKIGGKWQVKYQSGNDSDAELFEFVMICTGAFAYPNKPNIEGMPAFKGLKVHSGQVRNGGLFTDQRVLVIGGAYSGAEMMAMAIQNGAKKVYNSVTHRPDSRSAWCINRYVRSVYGDMRPWDQCMNRENAIDNFPDFGVMLAQWCYPFHKCSNDAFLNYPNDAFALTDLKRVRGAKQNGLLEFIGPIVKFDDATAFVQNGKELSDIDIVVFATGYGQRFPFLDHIWSRYDQEKCELYNYVVSPKVELDGLAFILMSSSSFSFLSYAEMQARWFTHKVMSRTYDAQGRIFDATEREHMNETIAEKHSQRQGVGVRFNLIDNSNLFIDYLAADIGVQPPDYKALIATGRERDIELGVALAYGPMSSTQYRIQGRHAWAHAAEQCIAMAKHVLGKYFDLYVHKVKNNQYPRSAILDPSKGPFSKY